MSWQQEELHEILRCKTPAEVFAVLRNESFRLGMNNVAIGIKLPLPIFDTKFVLYNDYSSEWQKKYAENGYLEIDPTVRHGLTSVLPTMWSDPALKGGATGEFWEEARMHGLEFGIAQPVWDRHGSCSMLTFSRSHLDFSRNELPDKMQKISWLAQLAHTAMLQLLLAKEVPESQVKLTSREKEVLKYCAEGFSSTQSAEKLGISAATNDFHIKNAMAKLNVSHRSQAVMIAHQLKLI